MKNIIPINLKKVSGKVLQMNTHVINCFNNTVIMQWFQKKAGMRNEVVVNRYSLGLCMLPCIEQGFARDFVMADENGFNDDLLGAEVVATNSGIVTKVVNTQNGLEEINDDNAGGNYVVIKHDGYYSMYCHLQLDSIAVKEGDKVERGQFLGLVGNTGNSSNPHLHFQLTYTDPNGLLPIGKPMSNFEAYNEAEIKFGEPLQNGIDKELKINTSGSLPFASFLN